MKMYLNGYTGSILVFRLNLFLIIIKVIELLGAEANWDWNLENQSVYSNPPEYFQKMLVDFPETTPNIIQKIFQTCVVADREKRIWSLKELKKLFLNELI